jgi:DNA polymerase I-like protein with 3'-5' exonuclease and polymerase domains
MTIAMLRKTFPDARPAGDGSILFACPVCAAEGRQTHAKLFDNGALSCPRAAGISTDFNREHCAPIREQLGLVGSSLSRMAETIAEGKYTLEAKPSERGKATITARNGTGIIHLDTFSLADAGKRATFVKALAFDDALTKDATSALLRLADRCESVAAATEMAADGQTQAVSFRALSDGRLIEQLASGFASYDGEAVSYCQAVEDEGITYRPLEDSFISEGGLLLPDALLEYHDDRALNAEIESYIQRHLDLSDRDRKLSAAYIRLTYLFDKLLELPYLRPIGPRGNGKSRFVSVIGGICYRPVTLISPSAASLFRIVDRFKPTLIVDEANFSDSGDDTQALMQILNAGYQRIARVPRAEGNNGQFEVRLFDAYCPKLIASLKASDSQAFESRCIQIQMERTRRKDIRLRLSGQLLKEQAELRAKLTLWRLRNWRRDFEDLLDQAEAELKRHDIEPRYVQVSTPLFALIADASLKAEFIKMVKGRDEADAEERKESFDGQLVTIIHGLLFEVDEAGEVPPRATLPEEGKPCEAATVEAITQAINEGIAEKKQHQTRWIGRQLRKLGFQTAEISRRQSPVWKKSALVFDRNSFARLFKLYALPLSPDFSSGQSGQFDNLQENQQDSLTGLNFDEADTGISSGQPNYQEMQQVAGVTGLTGSKMPEMGAEQQTEAYPVVVALDTETERFDEKRGITPRTCQMIGLALSSNGEDAEYVTDAKAWTWLMPEPEQTVIFHNAKFDLSVLNRTGLPLPEKWEDTLIAAHLLNEKDEHGLKPLAKQHLGIDDPLTFEEADRMRLLNPEVFDNYAKNDARFTFQLWQQFQPELERQELMPVYELEKDVVKAVIAMEDAGMKLDLSQMGEMSKAVADETRRIEAEIYEAAGCRFDLNSPQKVAAILFDKLNVPSQKLTKGGQRSVDKEALEDVRGYHPAVDALLRFREIDKLASTFLNVLPKFADSNGRIHPEFKPLGAKTGRFSCANPNVQQIPARSELGKKLRQMFIADEGHSLVVADWSQMELRILAHYSQDPLLLQAYSGEQETDLHSLTAARMFGKAETEVLKEERAVAKMINFGIAYGITPIGLFNRLKPSGIDVTEVQCEQFIRDYFLTYPKVRKFLDDVMQTVRRRGYVKSLYGRRRRVMGHSGREIRQAQNFVIQATAADLAKAAMVKLHQTLPAGARLIAMVHNEFIVECRSAQAKQVKQLMEAVMSETPDNFTVPMVVEAKIGHTWGACK